MSAFLGKPMCFFFALFLLILCPGNPTAKLTPQPSADDNDKLQPIFYDFLFPKL